MNTPSENHDDRPSEWNLKQRFKLALKYSAPVAMGYYPAGIAFGVLASAAHLPVWLSALLSAVLYSGAAQYAAIPLLASGAGIAALTLNTLVINLRHIFYALPLLSSLPLRRAGRIYALFALTDESFSVLTTLPEPCRRPLFLLIVVLNHFYWFSATIIGVMLGAGLNALIPNLDFALTCLFAILAYEQYQSKRMFWPCALAAVSLLLVRLLTEQYVLLAAVGLCVTGITMRYWSTKR